MRRVGVEISATDRWRDVGASYASDIDGAYHRHRLDVIAALLPDLASKRVIDFGCGEGLLIRHAIEGGAREVIGIDPDERLLGLASNSGAAALLKGSVEQLASIEHADCIIAANVAAYFTDDQNRAFYEQAARILAPDGHLVITHSNELFDLFTLNAFTVAFHLKHFGVDVSALLAHSDKPQRSTFNVRENPLAYPDKLQRFGFSIIDMQFMNLHAEPPLLSADDPDDMRRPRPDTLNTPPEDRWKLMFQCSMFGVTARLMP
jgi:2-polyprenyl-3-methyl-5-hydroxy-6-metoxy-1,4-benzoquinol methylase